MLVIVCGMIRSGSTLLYQTAVALAEAAGVGAGAGWDWDSIDPAFAAPGSPIRVVKVHDPNPTVESAFDPEQVKFLYSYRDLRDVAVSYYDKRGYGRAEPPATALTWLPEPLAAYHHFTTRRHVHIFRYEDTVSDLGAMVRRTRTALALDVSDASCGEIARALTLDRQRARIAASDVYATHQWDPHTLLHHNHISDARVGKWRDELPPEHIDYIERQAGDWLLARGYQLSRPPRDHPNAAMPLVEAHR